MPGTSGVLSPFGKIEGLYFNDSDEPNDYEYDFKQDLEKLLSRDGVEYIKIKADNKEDYYKILDSLYKFNENCITISGVSNEEGTVIIEESKDLDDPNTTDSAS